MGFDAGFGFFERHADDANTSISAEVDRAVGGNQVFAGNFLLGGNAEQRHPDFGLGGFHLKTLLYRIADLWQREPHDADRLILPVDLVETEAQYERAVDTHRELATNR